MRRLMTLVILLLSSAPALVQAAGGLSLSESVHGSWRTPAFVQRDPYRHPQEVLEFFGISPSMTVLELAPGSGWWTEILAPYLKDQGLLIEAIPPASATGFMGKMRAGFMAKLQAAPELYANVKTVPFAPPQEVTLGQPGSVDMVLTFRNLHDWQNDGSLASVFQAAFAVLKPGGVFGVVEHRALPYADAKTSSKALHRLPEDFVIGLGLQTGFQLAAVSDLNANPRDSLTLNVHRLLPDLSHDSAAEKKEYSAVGESDRMTLKFIKPLH